MTAPAEYEGVGAADPLLEKAIFIVTTTGRPSVSAVQRQLAIGYGRADRMFAAMEQRGFVKRNTGPIGAPWSLA